MKKSKHAGVKGLQYKRAFFGVVMALLMFLTLLPHIAAEDVGNSDMSESVNLEDQENNFGEDQGGPIEGEHAPGDLSPPSDEAHSEATAKYTVSFYDGQKNLFYQEVVGKDEKAKAPTMAPAAPEGMRFLGWFEEGAEEAYAFDKNAMGGDLHLYAVYEPIEGHSEGDPSAKTESSAGDTPGSDTADIDETGSVQAEMGPAANSMGIMPMGSFVTYTVTFEVNGTLYRTETVIEETLLTLPPNPSSSGGGAFVGWYTQSGDPFNPQELIVSDMTLVAKFSDSAVLVTYMNTDNTILEVLEGEIGQPAPAPTKSLTLDTGKQLDYWALQGTTIPFTGTLTESITLYPVLADMSIVIFITNGSEVDPQVGPPGFTATSPAAPTRSGYTFNGWTENSDGTGTFNFATPINGIVYLYAKWTPSSTPYTLNIWVEKPDIVNPGDPLAGGRSDYAIQYTKSMTGITGSTASFTDATARTEATTASPEVQKLLVYCTFKASESAVLSSAGDTVVNVFFTRTEFTLIFDATKTSASGPSLTGSEIFLKDGSSVGSVYPLTIKLDQTVSDVWPAKVTLTGTNFQNWSAYYGLGTYKINYDAIAVSFSSSNPVPNSYNYNVTTPLRTTWTVYARTIANPMTETRHYYVELTDAEKNDYLYGSGLPGVDVRIWTSSHAVYGGPRYYKWALTGGTNNQVSVTATGIRTWPGVSLEGFETIVSSTNTSTDPTTCRTTFFQELVGRPGAPRDFDIMYYMPRKAYVLTLVTGSGIISPVGGFTPGAGIYTASVKFQEPVDSLLPSTVNLSGYNFEGWYLDENYDEPYAAGTTMPASALTLYARYRGQAVSVTYNDGQNIKTNTYAMNEALTAHELAGTAYDTVNKGDLVPGKGIFEGWYYEVGSISPPVMIEFPLNSTLTKSNYVLYAKFTPVIYTVTFAGDESGAGTITIVYDTQTVKTGYNTLARSGYSQLRPTRVGYDFIGWSTVLGGTTVDFTTATPVTADITVYAIWVKRLYTVTFQTNGGTPIAPITGIPYGDTIAEPPSPVKKGEEFLGWYADPGLSVKWNFFTDGVTKNMTLYAKWARDGSGGGSSDEDDLPSDPNGSANGDGSGSGSMGLLPIGVVYPYPIEGELVTEGSGEQSIPATGANTHAVRIFLVLLCVGSCSIMAAVYRRTRGDRRRR